MLRSVSRLAFLCCAYLSIPVLASATPLDLTYSVMGAGGRSGPQAGFSDTSFWWIDTTGGLAPSAVTSFGFDPFPAFARTIGAFEFSGDGSLLLSSPFSLDSQDTLEVSLSL